VFPVLRPPAGRQGTRDEVAFQLHPGGKGHHVEAFLVRDRDRVMGEDSGDVLQCQAVLADVDDVVQPLGLLAADAVIQADQQVCVPGTSSTSCDQAIFVDHAIDASVSSDAVSFKINRFR
jgi:hypothetical protein